MKNVREIRFLRELYYCYLVLRDKHSFRHGKRNVVSVKGVRVNTRIQISGNDNCIIAEEGSVLKSSLIKVCGNNARVLIHKNAYISGVELWLEDNNCTIEIGENSFVGHHSHLACTEDGCSLSIGNDSMLSSYVQIRTGDSHSVLDMEGNRINPASSVVIGNHCWVCEGVKILKGVVLEQDVIVSTGSVVTNSFGKNVLLGGAPAKVVKENVSWDSRRL